MRRPDAPTVREALVALRDELRAAGVESPRVEAERLLAHALEIDRARLALEGGRRLSPEGAAELARLVGRRVGGEPLQHIEGTVEFRQLVLKADRRALIPRPETEQLVELVVRDAREAREATRGAVRTVPRPGAARHGPPVPSALDVGTGGGAIALSLLAEGLAARVVALDVSDDALAQARENRELTGIDASRVDFRRCGPDPFADLGGEERFDLLVSNPPYVRDGEIPELPAEIREHEPREALSGGADGLTLLRLIAARAPGHLVPGGRLYLELGAGQGQAALEMFSSERAWTGVRRRRDLAGRDRFVTATRR